MRKISEDEYNALPLIGKGPIGALYRAVAQLSVGEILLLEKADHKKKYHPGITVKRVGKRLSRKYEVLTIATGEGWTIKRLD